MDADLTEYTLTTSVDDKVIVEHTCGWWTEMPDCIATLEAVAELVHMHQEVVHG